jgi:assimilatory nitrate reductase catalytic subunit
VNHPDQPNRIRTTCAYCGVGCGLEVSVAAGNAGQPVPRVELRGDAAHPANHGRLCSKGSALGETLGLDNRLLHPQIGGLRASWNLAIDTIANRLRDIIAESGPEAVAFYVSGQLLTEDYYVANKLMKGFIGSANIDTNSRLCMSSAASAHKRAFGSDSVPGCYEDLELADLVVLVGSNAAWTHPVVYQRIVKPPRPSDRMKRRGDRPAPHRHLRPGRPASGRSGPAQRCTGCSTACSPHLASRDRLDPPTFAKPTPKVSSAALAVARPAHPDRGQHRGLCRTKPTVAEFCSTGSRDTEKTVTLFSQGINQSSGVDKGNAIINCHLATGRIGKPGAAPFSITGQPNAMGGREVGGLANSSPRTWIMPIRPTSTAWPLLGRAEHGAAAGPEGGGAVRGRRRWPRQGGLDHAGTNPAVSLPEADRVRPPCAAANSSVVSDCEGRTDTQSTAPMCCCQRPPGARRMAPSPTPNAASRASVPFCRCRARPDPTGGSSPRWRARWASMAAFDYDRSPIRSFASTRALQL